MLLMESNCCPYEYNNKCYICSPLRDHLIKGLCPKDVKINEHLIEINEQFKTFSIVEEFIRYLNITEVAPNLLIDPIKAILNNDDYNNENKYWKIYHYLDGKSNYYK